MIQGNEAMDTIFGDGGDDTITAGLGDDIVDGGAENDFMLWEHGDGNDRVSGGDGSDKWRVIAEEGLKADQFQVLII